MAADYGMFGIRINAVSPGYIETPLSEMLKSVDDLRERFVSMHPLKRAGQPEEVAAAIAFLLSDEAGFITGANLPVDGGIEIAKALEMAGAHMLVLSNGLNAESVSSMFGSNLPASVLRPLGNAIERKVMDWMKISGFEKIDFQELYLLEHARQICKAVSMLLCYLGGVQSLQ